MSLPVSIAPSPPVSIRHPLVRWMGLLALGVFLLTSGGHTYSPDEEERYYVARGLLEQRSLAVTIPTTAEAAVAGDRLVDGRNYAKYGLGGSLVALPFYAVSAGLARWLAPDRFEFLTRAAVTLPVALASAAGVAALVLLILRLGFRPPVAAGVGTLFAFATMAWVYARTSFVEPVVGFCLLAALLALHGARADGEGGRRRLLAAGGWLGLGVLCRLDTAILLPWFGFYALCWPRLAAAWRRSPPAALPILFVRLLPLAAGPIFALLLSGAYNAARFGSPLETGYGTEVAAFATPWRLGLLGLLSSPGRGIVWYAPPCLLALAGLRRFARRHPAEAVLIAGAVGTALVFFARWSAWHGGGGYGPRLLLPVLPLLLLPAASFLAPRPAGLGGTGRARAGRVGRYLATATVVAVSLVTIPPGVLVHFGSVSNAADAASERAQLFDPRHAPPARHWAFLVDSVRYWLDYRTMGRGQLDVVFLDGLELGPAARTGAYLPAWTAPRLRLALPGRPPSDPLRLTLVYRDFRPPALLPTRVDGWVDDRATTTVAGTRGDRLTFDLILEATGSSQAGSRAAGNGSPDGASRGTGTLAATVEITPWVVDDLDWHPGPLARGVLLEAIALDGRPLARFAARTPPPPEQPRLLFSWFWHPGLHHLDLWPWYAALAGFSRAGIALLVVTMALLVAVATWRVGHILAVGPGEREARGAAGRGVAST